MIEIKKQKDGTYRFNLKTALGRTLLKSVDFNSRDSLDQVIKGLPPLLDHQGVFERQTDHNGKFLFLLKDVQGAVIGHSKLYSSEAGMENGIKNLKKRIASLS